MDEKIAKLVGFYYRTLVDHHKDRDCHFYINTVWSYGRPAVYRVEHNGYINEFDDEFPTYAEAEEFLRSKIEELIRAEIKHSEQAEPDNTGWGYSQDEIDANRRHMASLEKDLNELCPPNITHRA